MNTSKLRKVNVSRILLILSPWIISVGLWFAITQLGFIRSVILPGPIRVAASFKDFWHVLPRAMAISLFMIITGFVIGTVLGVGMGLAMAYSHKVLDAFAPVYLFLRPVPIFALVPLYILWFGIGRVPQIALITTGVFIVIGVSTMEAIRNISPVYVQAAYTLGASRRQAIRTIVIPCIFPHLIGSIRVAANAAFSIDVAAEFMGSQEGLGFLMLVQANYLKTHGIMAIAGLYCITAFIFDRIIGAIETKLTEWTGRRVVGGGFSLFHLKKTRK